MFITDIYNIDLLTTGITRTFKVSREIVTYRQLILYNTHTKLIIADDQKFALDRTSNDLEDTSNKLP